MEPNTGEGTVRQKYTQRAEYNNNNNEYLERLTRTGLTVRQKYTQRTEYNDNNNNNNNNVHLSCVSSTP